MNKTELCLCGLAALAVVALLAVCALASVPGAERPDSGTSCRSGSGA